MEELSEVLLQVEAVHRVGPGVGVLLVVVLVLRRVEGVIEIQSLTKMLFLACVNSRPRPERESRNLVTEVGLCK